MRPPEDLRHHWTEVCPMSWWGPPRLPLASGQAGSGRLARTLRWSAAASSGLVQQRKKKEDNVNSSSVGEASAHGPRVPPSSRPVPIQAQWALMIHESRRVQSPAQHTEISFFSDDEQDWKPLAVAADWPVRLGLDQRRQVGYGRRQLHHGIAASLRPDLSHRRWQVRRHGGQAAGDVSVMVG